MVEKSIADRPILRDLGDGLILRQATYADADALADFNAHIHGEEDSGKPDERIRVWTHDLATKPHPTFTVGDYTIVEDTRTGAIVSTMNLIPQTWSYGGIPFEVGRPELVGTNAEYRNRGLVRAQFDVVHQWSAERGHRMQAITGIPYYYRLFGYEMGLSLGGGRVGFPPHIPKLKEGEEEPYRLRAATEDDLPFISGLYDAACRRYLVNCVWDADLWRYELNGKSDNNVNRMVLVVIETPEGESVGYLGHSYTPWGPTMVAMAYEVKQGVSWGEVTPSVARYLMSTGEACLAQGRAKEPVGAYGFWMGSEHPVYQVLNESLPRVRKPYAWFVRVPDLPGFLQHVAPVLEQRLAESPYAGHSAEVKITFYRSGLRLRLEKGRLAEIESWKPTPQGDSGDAGFPDLTFLQLLFGYRSFDELKYAFADCWSSNDQVHGLLTALFPKQNSNILPVA